MIELLTSPAVSTALGPGSSKLFSAINPESAPGRPAGSGQTTKRLLIPALAAALVLSSERPARDDPSPVTPSALPEPAELAPRRLDNQLTYVFFEDGIEDVLSPGIVLGIGLECHVGSGWWRSILPFSYAGGEPRSVFSSMMGPVQHQVGATLRQRSP